MQQKKYELLQTIRGSLSVRSDTVKGRGVYALRRFRKNQIVEICEVIILNYSDIAKTKLDAYAYMYSAKTAAIALGFGSLYNHADLPNAAYEFRGNKLVLRAARNIKPHEEVTIDYGFSRNDRIKYGIE